MLHTTSHPLGVRDRARVREYVALAQSEEILELGDPVGHVHRPPVQRLNLGEAKLGLQEHVLVNERWRLPGA